jgi:hypothetical protein
MDLFRYVTFKYIIARITASGGDHSEDYEGLWIIPVMSEVSFMILRPPPTKIGVF